MKFRNGFVSNSSSSSFLIGFLRKPRSWKEIKSLLFGDMEHVQYIDYVRSTKEIAKTIFNDLKGKRELSVAKMEKELEGNFPGCPQHWQEERLSDKLENQFAESFPQYKGVWWTAEEVKETMAKQLIAKIRAAQKEENEKDEAEMKVALGKHMKSKVLPMMKGRKVYALEYSDHDNAVIEHGDVFCNLPHIRISHH